MHNCTITFESQLQSTRFDMSFWRLSDPSPSVSVQILFTQDPVDHPCYQWTRSALAVAYFLAVNGQEIAAGPNVA